MIGIAIIGGVTPLCAAQEAGYNLDIKVADDYAVSSVVVKGLQINGESKSLVNFTLQHTLW